MDDQDRGPLDKPFLIFMYENQHKDLLENQSVIENQTKCHVKIHWKKPSEENQRGEPTWKSIGRNHFVRTNVENHRNKPFSENQRGKPPEETILCEPTWRTTGRNHLVRTNVENHWKKPFSENQRGEPPK